MDKAAAFAAIRRARSTAVTVAIEDIEFKTPIKQGELVELVARVEEVGRTSMRVWVEVIPEIPMDDHRELCMVGYFTMVALARTAQAEARTATSLSATIGPHRASK